MHLLSVLTLISLGLFSLSLRAQVTPNNGITYPGATPSGTNLSPINSTQSGQSPSIRGTTPYDQSASKRQISRQQRGLTPSRNTKVGRTNNQPANLTTRIVDADTVDRINTYQTDEAVLLEDGYQRARRLEGEKKLRRLFGYALFNDPSMKDTFQPNLSLATPRNYVVGPGDELTIRLYGLSEIDFSQSVSPEGTIYFANQTGIGPVHVAGLPIEQVKGRILNRLATKFVGLRQSAYGPANTFLDVSLGSIRSIRVTVTGDAVRPGTYTLSSLSTVMNATYQAGGPNELGSFRKVELIRQNKVIATLDLYDYLLSGMQRNDLRLQDNDVIHFTTYQSRVEIIGTVKRNNIFELLPTETFDQLLVYAGDFAANAYRGRVKVQRLTDRELKVIDLNAADYKTFVMRDGDVVTVEQVLDRFENQVTIEGAVYRPGQFSLDQNKTLKQLITSAEGLKGDAFTGRVNIVRTRDDVAVENISVNLTNIHAGTEPDVVLQREDKVIISSYVDLAEPAIVSVQGEVNSPNENIPYMANMTLEDALLRVGGLKESAAASHVDVVRRKKDVDPRSTSALIAQTFSFNVNRDLSITRDHNHFVLEPFDHILVRKSPNYLIQTYASVEGEVVIPGAYPIGSRAQKVSDLVRLAGGLTPYAYVDGATLIRRVRLSEDEIARRQKSVTELAQTAAADKAVVEAETLSRDKPEQIGINLQKILSEPGSSEDILVQDGDVLRIPKVLETVRIQGEVALPTTVKYRPGQTFQDYIAQSGGFTSRSQRGNAFIVYANGTVDRTKRIMFVNVYPHVKPGSEVIIPKKTAKPVTPQEVLNSANGITSSLLSLVSLLISLSRTGN